MSAQFFEVPYAQWHEEAERAQDQLIDVLHALLRTPVAIPQDLPLRQIALGLHAMRMSDLDKARAAHDQMETCFRDGFLQPGTCATARHRNVLVRWSRPIIAHFAALPIFDEDGPRPEALDEDALVL